jgi:hypothetical protein
MITGGIQAAQQALHASAVLLAQQRIQQLHRRCICQAAQHIRCCIWIQLEVQRLQHQRQPLLLLSKHSIHQ